MIKMMNAFIITILFTILGTVPAAVAEENNNAFADMDATHWAYSTVTWGMDNKVLSGYPDHMFKPEQFVTEAEFLKILISAYETPPESGSEWYEKYYSYATNKSWFVPGLKNKLAINNPVSRGQVAVILASSLGNSFVNGDTAEIEKSINILYDKNLSSGKDAKTVEGFAPKDNLTRAEAVTFVYNFKKNSGLTSLLGAVNWSNYDSVSLSDVSKTQEKQQLFAKANNFEAREYKNDKDVQFVDFVADGKSALLSSYQTENDGTVNWTVAGHFGVIDYKVMFDYIIRMTSYAPDVQEVLISNTFPSVVAHGIRSTDDMSGVHGRLSAKAHYTKETDTYQFIFKISPK